ncbi:hypothetical protein NXC24_PC01753 (plasmid) [Rhizobium sp. NXC24]|nr:hypothetical protein NXC24_PC01753 [Rhizobium sp. NXC24]
MSDPLCKICRGYEASRLIHRISVLFYPQIAEEDGSGDCNRAMACRERSEAHWHSANARSRFAKAGAAFTDQIRF